MNSPLTGIFFINYRIDDTKDVARRLEKALDEAFKVNVAFRDEGDINLGQDWKREILTALGQAEVMLSLIGPDWIDSFEKKGGNKESGAITDWVQKEINYAFEEGIDVIPVLLPGAKLCSPEEAPAYFPSSLHFMLTRQGFVVEKNREEEGFQKIITRLKSLLGKQGLLDRKEKEVRDQHALQSLEPLTALPLPESYPRKLRELDEADDYRIKDPYMGPMYFSEDHAALFFGREWEIRRLFHRVRKRHLCLLDGYSGSGKSSLIHAGLLPRMKGLAKWKLWPPLRRNKQEGGLHKQLEYFLDQMELPEGKKGLLILDQVEEMYTDPLPEDKQIEIQRLGEMLDLLLFEHKQLHILLVFRSEYVRLIDRGLVDTFLRQHPVAELPLGPLSLDGVRQAILGPQGWERRFPLQIEEETVAYIARDFVGNEFTPYGILLQIQLLHLWKLASEEATNRGRRSPRIFSRQLYDNNRLGDLGRFVADQLEHIAHSYSWGERIHKGLGLDVLYLFTTEEGTATSCKDEVFKQLYAHLEGVDAQELLDAFKRVYLLSTAGLKVGESRLAHDSIAQVVRRKYLNSDACAQRAWRIVETKMREIEQGFEHVSLSESDIASLEEGGEHMRAIPEEVLRIQKQDAFRYQKQRQDRFEVSYEEAKRRIEHLEYAEALKRLKIAKYEGIEFEKLRELAWELPYVLLELGETPLFRESLKFLQQVGENADWLEKILGNLIFDREEVQTILINEKPDWYARMEAQYYPEMVKIPGGSFDMGSDEGIFEDEEPIHTVHLSAYQIGATSITFFQYGVFCLDIGKPLPVDSGFGRGNRPVINVNWSQALEYCNWLSKRKGFEPVYTKISGTNAEPNWAAKGFRLPTEAEWEYAAREGGKHIRFGNGKDDAIPSEINFDSEYHGNGHESIRHYITMGESRKATTPVKSFAPNALGLFDMSGNVFDWCWDSYSAEYYKEYNGMKDPKGPDHYEKRVIRGGSWYTPGYLCRCVFRNQDIVPWYDIKDVGFRLAMYL